MDNATEKRRPEFAPLRANFDTLKTGLDTAGFDIKDVLPHLLPLLAKSPELINALIQLLPFIIALFAKKPDVIIPPKPLEPATPVTPVKPPDVASNPYASIPARLELKIKGVKRDGVHISNKEVDRVRSEEDPVNVDGDVVNLDCTPYDDRGDPIEKGMLALEGLLVDPRYGTYLHVGDPMTYRYDSNGNPYPTGKPWPAGYDNHRAHHEVSGPGKADQGGEYRNFGLGVNVNPTSAGRITVKVRCRRADGVEVLSNPVSFRAEWWQK
jgi:hypothetical protein